jgi:hypothetical protein
MYFQIRRLHKSTIDLHQNLDRSTINKMGISTETFQDKELFQHYRPCEQQQEASSSSSQQPPRTGAIAPPGSRLLARSSSNPQHIGNVIQGLSSTNDLSATALSPHATASLLQVIRELSQQLERAESEKSQLRKDVRHLKNCLKHFDKRSMKEIRFDDQESNGDTRKTTTGHKRWKKCDRWENVMKQDKSMALLPPKRSVEWNEKEQRPRSSCSVRSRSSFVSTSKKDGQRRTSKSFKSALLDGRQFKYGREVALMSPRRSRSCSSMIQTTIPEEPDTEEQNEDETLSPAAATKSSFPSSKVMLLREALETVQDEIGGILHEEPFFNPNDDSSGSFSYHHASSDDGDIFSYY